MRCSSTYSACTGFTAADWQLLPRHCLSARAPTWTAAGKLSQRACERLAYDGTLNQAAVRSHLATGSEKPMATSCSTASLEAALAAPPRCPATDRPPSIAPAAAAAGACTPATPCLAAGCCGCTTTLSALPPSCSSGPRSLAAGSASAAGTCAREWNEGSQLVLAMQGIAWVCEQTWMFSVKPVPSRCACPARCSGTPRRVLRPPAWPRGSRVARRTPAARPPPAQTPARRAQHACASQAPGDQ